MIRYSLFLAAVWSLGVVRAQHPSGELRVLSYNIHHAEGIDGQVDLERIAAVIRAAEPDIVALQEVDQHVSRTASIDQPEQLARLTQMRVVFGGNLHLQGGYYGNAILSKLPIVSHENILLPLQNNGEQRGVIVAQLEFHARPLAFMATHFDHRRDDSERFASAVRVNDLAMRRPEFPAILAGDINAARESRVLKMLSTQWSIAGEESPTIPAAEPQRQIDFIFFRPANRWQVVQTRVLENQVASDHRAILAVLRMTDPEREQPPEARSRQPILAISSDEGEIETAETADQWQRRRRAIVSAMESVMGTLPRETDRRPPAITVVEEVDCGLFVRQKITYQSQPGCETPAYLCIPKAVAQDRSQRAPAVLCLHPTDDQVGHDVVVGLGGKANRQYAKELAERGYVTLSPSYPLLANYQPDLAALGWESGTLKAVWDNVRGIDLLESFPFVDGDSIGVIGHSLGGHNAVFTAVFDDRLRAVVSSCGLDSFRDYYDGDPTRWLPGQGWTQQRYMPRLADYHGRLEAIPFDFDEMLASLAPRNVLVIAPLHDGNFRADSVDRVTNTARQVFALYGCPQHLLVLHPDCQHDFPIEMREAAYRMFDGVLKGSRP